MSEKPKIYGVTGHRPETMGFQDPRDKLKFIELIRVFVKSHPGRYVVGGARGFDTWVALAALRCGYQVDVYLPFPEDIFAAKWFDPTDRAVLDDIVERARQVVIFSEVYRTGVYIERDEEIVDVSTEIFAGYDGREKGGTAATVRYARKLQRPIWVLDPQDLEAGVVREEKP